MYVFAHRIGQSFRTAFSASSVEWKYCLVSHKTSRVLTHVSSSELHRRGHSLISITSASTSSCVLDATQH